MLCMYTVQAKSAKAPKSGISLCDSTKHGENCGACGDATCFDRFALQIWLKKLWKCRYLPMERSGMLVECAWLRKYSPSRKNGTK